MCTEQTCITILQHDELPTIAPSEVEFIFIRLTVLREYLSRDLLLTGLSFPYDFEVRVLPLLTQHPDNWEGITPTKNLDAISCPGLNSRPYIRHILAPDQQKLPRYKTIR